MNYLYEIRERVMKKPVALECIFIFLSCAFIYLANNKATAAGDGWSNSQLAFSWLLDNSLNFDAFRDAFPLGKMPHALTEALNGHLTSSYPIGPSIISFPLYFIFSVYLKFSDWLYHVSTQLNLSGLSIGTNIPDITDPDFRIYRANFAKVAATLSTSLSVVIFYLAVRLKFNPFIALTVTFVFAFATGTWVDSSQAMLQHGFSNLELVSIILCLLKANRSEGQKRRMLLVIAGFFAGLLPGTRPPCALFSITALIYSVYVYRQEALYFLIGCLSFLFSAIWNIYYFGFSLKSFIFGGYVSHAEGTFASTAYLFTPQQFLRAFLGLSISPSRGLLVFSPVLFFCLYGIYKVFRLRHYQDEALFACLSIATLAVLLQYFFYTVWIMGLYGSRFVLDIIVLPCYLLAYFLSSLMDDLQRQKTFWRVALLSAFFITLLYSTSVQAIGAFGGGSWLDVPMVADSRIWDWRDSEISRNTNYIYFKLFDPIQDHDKYVKGLDGVIEQVKVAGKQEPSLPLVVEPSLQLLLEAQVKNTGTQPWLGYETGLVNDGSAYISVRFFDSVGKRDKVGRNRLYVSGTTEPGETTTAIGVIKFPAQVGKYRAVFRLDVSKIGRLRHHVQPFELAVEVVEKQSSSTS